jgi:anti-sigma-K factor RskA
MTEETRRPMTCEQARDLAAGYVLGALDRTEEAAVRAHLETCDQPHPEFPALGGVVPALLDLDPSELVEPPASLRDRIMAAAAADGRAEPATTPSKRVVPFPAVADRTTPATRRIAAASRFDWALRIAAVIAIVAAGAWGFTVQGQLDRARAYDQAIAAVVHAAGQPGAKTVVLSPQKGFQASGIAAVQATGSVVLAMRDLQPTSGSQVYTAWVIVGSNAPVSVGDFPQPSGGNAAMTTKAATTPAGATIALTLEPNAGNTAPKGDIVSAGVAAAPPTTSG